MTVTRWQILARGLTLRCPNCGARTAFHGLFRMYARCAHCGLVFEREEGFFIGALVINYTVTAVPLLLPLLVAVFVEVISVRTALIVAGVWCVIVPVLFYNPSRSLWMMLYYLVFPRDLPANQPTGTSGR
jgi:uncharacterized protein (DUF983 family)